MSQANISCALHDYIEIACLHRYQVRLAQKNGQVFEGKAEDIITTPDKRELLVLDNGHRVQIDLNQLVKMTTLATNAAFKEVTF